MGSMADRLLGSHVVAAVGRRLPDDHFRVLAYHEVVDAAAFGRQMDHLVRDWSPVDAAAVCAALSGGPPLPPRSVWITFDDGHRSVFEIALPQLTARGLAATAFVCPGAASTGESLWPDIVRAAAEQGVPLRAMGREWDASSLIATLKRVDDEVRRGVVDALRPLVVDPRLVGTEAHLREWVAAGCDLGNHSWDHPCLDRCRPSEIEGQIVRSETWLREQGLASALRFAHPNGNRSEVIEGVLRERGYELCALFDHRLARTTGDPLRCSRLRVSADATLPRFRAVLSGAHSGIYQLRQRLRPDLSELPRRGS